MNELESVNYINNVLAVRSGIKLDQDRVKEAVLAVYDKEKGKKPENFYFFQSPKAMGLAICEVLQKPLNDWEKVLKSQDLFPSNHCIPSFFYVRHTYADSVEIMDKYIAVIESARYIVFYQDEVLVCGYPDFVKYEGLQMHADEGPAIRYPDGHEEYFLWGIKVPSWAGVPAKDLDASKIMAIENVDQRAVLQRKYGLDKFRDHLKAEVIDSNADYELITLELQGNDDDRKRRCGPFLVMKGATNKEITHVEGVGTPGLDSELKTIEQAHMFRDPRLKPGFTVQWRA